VFATHFSVLPALPPALRLDDALGTIRGRFPDHFR
jgi:hypothetical protein